MSRVGFVAIWCVLAIGDQEIADSSCPAGGVCAEHGDALLQHTLEQEKIGLAMVAKESAPGSFVHVTHRINKTQSFTLASHGRVCHYNFISGGAIAVDQCEAACANRPGCSEFSVGGNGGGLGCRYAKDSTGCCSNVVGANKAAYCTDNSGWNAAGCADNSCSFYVKVVPAPAYHLTPPGSSRCDSGTTPTADQCLAAVQALADYEEQTMGRSTLQQGSGVCGTNWGKVPVGCSAQSGGDWAAHYSTSLVSSSGSSMTPEEELACVDHMYQLVCSGAKCQTRLTGGRCPSYWWKTYQCDASRDADCVDGKCECSWSTCAVNGRCKAFPA